MDGLDKLAVVGIGELLWDVFPDRKVMGGAPANFAYHISQFGLEGWAVSAVGNDPDGSELLARLRDKPLRTHIDTVPFPTGRVEVMLDGRGVPEYVIAEGSAWDNIPPTDELNRLASRTGTVCFGTLAQRSETSRRTIRGFMDAMPAGSLKIFDINLRQHYYSRPVIEESLQHADILKINDEEVAIVSSLLSIDGSESEICRRLMEIYSLRTVVLTRGTEGSFVFTSDGEESFLTTPVVNVVDTVGAGDSFTAAFIAALLRGKTVPDAHRLAVEVSAFVCSCAGAMPELPSSLTSRLD